MKKIIVLPVKNESWILPYTLPVFSQFADIIIIADQASTDNTADICKKFPKVKIVNNPEKYHSSNVRKLLLDAAREYSGNNAIFSFDADEIPTAHILSEEFNKTLANLKPGTALQLEWVQLWKSTGQYRTNHYSSPENKYPVFGFIDDRQANYDTLNVINDHTYRVPFSVVKNKKLLDYPKVLHFQFVDFTRNLAKQRLYQMTELIRRGRSIKNAVFINYFYTPPKDERNVQLKEVPREWLKHADLEALASSVKKEYWYDTEVLQLFQEKEPKFFAWLDIWQKDLNRIQQIYLKRTKKQLKDPRDIVIKLYHKAIFVVYDLLRVTSKALKLFRLRKAG